MKIRNYIRLVALVVITAALMLPALIAAAGPSTLTITMSSGARFHSSVVSQRWVGNTGNVVYCMEQGLRFSNSARSFERGGQISNDQVRGILTYGFPTRSASALGSSAGVSLNNAEAQAATQFALWSVGWGSGNTVSISAGNAQGAAGARVLSAARWLVANASDADSSTFHDFYLYSNGRAGYQRMIYAVGEAPCPEATLIKSLARSRGGLMADPTRGVVDPRDGYIYYGPLTDSRFVLHTGTSAASASANAIANTASTRVGTYSLQRGTLRAALDPCPDTSPNLDDHFTDSQLANLANAGITSWSDIVAFLALDGDTQRANLSPGWHAFSETHVPTGYHTREDAAAAVNLSAGEMGISVFNNVPITGHIYIEKRCGNQSLSRGNPAYSLAGARFEIRDMWGSVVGVVTTNAQGRANTYDLDFSRWAEEGRPAPNGLPLGRYTITEIQPPANYALDSSPVEVRLSAANMSTSPLGNSTSTYDYYAVANATFINMPQNNPVDVVLEKVDSETGLPLPQGGATLSGARFEINFYHGPHSSTDLSWIDNASPVRTWIVETSAEGIARLSSDYIVPELSDPFFLDSRGNPTFPIGTVTIQEISPPVGYLINDEVFVRQITSSGYDEAVRTFVIPAVPEQIIRGDLRLVKVGDQFERLAGVPFRITSITTGESHVIVTDANGQASTESDWNPRVADTVNRGELYSDGVWFGHFGAMTDSKGALPFDTYIIEELRSESNADFDLIPPFRVVVSREAVTVNLGTLINTPPVQIHVSTFAKCGHTGTNYVHATEDALIIDGIWYNGLTPGQEYTFVGVLMDKSTGEPLLVSGKEVRSEVTFTPRHSAGSVEMPFEFDARDLGGRDLVVFQYLYKEGERIGEYACLDNEDQTVSIVALEEQPAPSPETTPTASSPETTPTAPTPMPEMGPKTGDMSSTTNLIAAMLAAFVLMLLIGYVLWRERRPALESRDVELPKFCLRLTFAGRVRKD